MEEEEMQALDEHRLANAARLRDAAPNQRVVYSSDGRAKVVVPWTKTFWSQVHTNLERNVRRRMMYDHLGGSERSPLNPVNAMWNH